MKKQLMVAILAMGFIFAGVLSASAGTIGWTIIETNGMASHSPGADNRLGTADDGTSDKCNYSAATACVVGPAPTTGSYSYSRLNFVQDSSCAIATGVKKAGDPCTDNASCGPGVCVDCNTGTGGVGLTYFAKNPNGGAKGLGTYTVDACEGGFTFSNVSIGTSEVLTASGGSCMTLVPGSDSTSGCSTGPVSTTYDLKLWTSTIPGCGFSAGTMPGLALAGRIYDAGVAPPTGACTYTTAQISGIIAGAGLGAGDYLTVMCGNGSLPTNLESVCIRGASWTAYVVAKTSVAVPTSCADSCGGCMAGTAEGVE